MAISLCLKGRDLVLLEHKVAKGSVAAGLVAGLVSLAVFLGKKFGIEIDPLVATPVASAVVVWVVAFVVGYVTKHTHRADLEDDVNEALGLEPRDMPDPGESDAPGLIDEDADQREVA